MVGGAAVDPAAALRRFIGRLIAACGRLRDSDGGAVDESLQSLTLAEAAMRYAAPGARPPQVAVLGPTQTGKSTVVNLLLGSAVAEVSPLAGFTVHPQGFAVQANTADDGWAKALFPGWRRCAPADLTRDDLGAFSLSNVQPAPALPPCVIWDTPDFDSLAARHYARGVLEVAALADLYLLVLSAEKYSDLSVWRLLELIAPLGRPLLIVLNKVTPDTQAALLSSLRQRLAERGQAWGDVPIVVLPYDAALAAGASAALAQLLRDAVRKGLSAGGHAGNVPALVRRHWDQWVAPVRAEHDARTAWNRMVQSAATEFLAAYTRDYLEHPQRYDSFRRAAVEVLTLLELPSVLNIVTRARQLVTWPARRAIAAGQTWWRARRQPRIVQHSLGVEATVLLDTWEVLLARLLRDVGRQCRPATAGYAFWSALEQKLTADLSHLRSRFEAALQAHHEQTTREIHAVANRLYAELQKSPARLAALRTARATIDLGSVLLVVKTGGLSLMDAVWAPAAFALASLFMEGVAGLELRLEARELKVRQRAAVEQELVGQTLVPQLARVPDGLAGAGVFGITAEELREATAALMAWEGRR
jgi:hypothetical protein